jgi:hypothetical protein
MVRGCGLRAGFPFPTVACLGRWVGGAHTKGIVFTQYLWCGQNRMREGFRAWLGDLGTQFGC